MKVEPIDDPATIDRILTDPWIADRIRHDAREPGYIDHPALTYHGAFVGGDLVGVFIAIRHSPWEIEVHAALSREATRHGRGLGAMFLASLWSDPELQRVTAPVLSTLPSAVNYCRRLGFELEGVRRRAVQIDGKVADVIWLGLLRPQLAAAS